MKYRGSCHCQAIQFEVDAPAHIEVEDCNCSICNKVGFLHLIVPLSAFTLLKGVKSRCLPIGLIPALPSILFANIAVLNLFIHLVQIQMALISMLGALILSQNQ